MHERYNSHTCPIHITGLSDYFAIREMVIRQIVKAHHALLLNTFLLQVNNLQWVTIRSSQNISYTRICSKKFILAIFKFGFPLF